MNVRLAKGSVPVSSGQAWANAGIKCGACCAVCCVTGWQLHLTAAAEVSPLDATAGQPTLHASEQEIADASDETR